MKLKSVIKYVLVFFLFTGIACEETTTLENTFTIGTPKAFRINQLYTSTDGVYNLLINEIGDSRCPEGVECIWSGEVTVKGEWTANKNKSNFELHSIMNQQQTYPTGFTIQIVHADPYPKYGADSKPENLVVTMLIKEK
ncbi:MAG: hypothetical protein Q8N05_18125 [Bacteroidota bacterium]|nr:hypothetical protein [Bacteroidota bacterium]